ncbi:nucleotide disphospho-sugar-binding domain-containing protein [Streptomyces coeruleorubidus]|uniref:nucleotide disphospho-sugar-binding domain-containing protein n=1 Tax=Streptomyces coeruleorubidus TaxID=116188 RepID=UPI00339F8B17
MRVLFTPFPATAHVNAQVPLAWALRSAGHDVRMASRPDVHDDILAAGVTAVPLGEVTGRDGATGPGRVEESPAWSGPEEEAWLGDLPVDEPAHARVHRALTAWARRARRTTASRPVIAELVGFARYWRPDLVVWDWADHAGAVAAMAGGAAHARLVSGLDLVGWTRGQYRGLPEGRPDAPSEDAFQEWLGPLLAEHGRVFAEEAVLGQWTVDSLPAPLRLPVSHRHVPVRHMPYNGFSHMPDWLCEPPTRPRVCLALGRSFLGVDGPPASAPALLDAFRDVDVEVVVPLPAGLADSLRDVPDNVRLVVGVPLDLLLPSCVSLIHHGGPNDIATALAHGVPQLMLPTRRRRGIPEARRVAGFGAGLYRQAEELSAAELRSMLLRVLHTPSFARAAAALRTASLAAPSPADLVPVLERLTTAYRISQGVKSR